MRIPTTAVLAAVLGISGLSVIGCSKSDADKSADQAGAAAHDATAQVKQDSANNSASDAASNAKNAASSLGDAAKSEVGAAGEKLDQLKDKASATTLPSTQPTTP
jgi:hypothetical protein